MRLTFLSAGSLLLLMNILVVSIWTVTCDTVSDLKDKFAGSKILLVGLLADDLLIITKDASPQVYEIPKHHLNDNSINLYNLTGESLQDKWPKLSSSDDFKKNVLAKSTATQSVSVKLQSEKLIFALYDENPNQKRLLMTVTYTIEPANASLQEYEMQDDQPLKEAHYISSTEPDVFYNLKLSTNDDNKEYYRLYKYSYQAAVFNMESQAVCKQLGGENGTEKIAFKSNGKDCPLLDWDIQNGGFYDQQRFHLFGKDKVYIFDYTSVGGNFSDAVVTSVPLADFFTVIKPTTMATHKTTEVTTQKSSMGIIIGVIALVGVLLLVVVIIVVCNQKSSKSNKNASISDSENEQRVFPSKASNQEAQEKPVEIPKESLGFAPKSSVAAKSSAAKTRSNKAKATKTSKAPKSKSASQSGSTKSKSISKAKGIKVAKGKNKPLSVAPKIRFRPEPENKWLDSRDYSMHRPLPVKSIFTELYEKQAHKQGSMPKSLQ